MSSSISPPNANSQTDSSQQETRAAVQAFQLLLKGIKNISIYRHAQARFPEYLAPAHHAFTVLLDEVGVLPFKVTPFALEYKKQIVYQDEDKENLTYKFYKDGLRYLIFRRGLPPEELLRFTMLAIDSYSEAELFHEDMVTRLWKEELTCIEHVVVEGFGFGDLSEEQVEVEVEKIIGYLRGQLAAKDGDPDITRFARLSADDLELELNDLEQVRGGIVSGRTAQPNDKAHIQDELFHEVKSRIFAKMVLILFQILELEASEDDANMMLDAITQVLDTLLVSEDINGAVALMQRFEQIADRPLPKRRGEMIRNLGDAFKRRMMEAHRLDAISQYLALNKGLDQRAVMGYLGVCREEDLIPLVDILSSMERQDARAVLVNVLADKGRKHVEIFARRLDHNSSHVVKDMLSIIERIDPPNKMQYFARCFEHPNIMIRLEGMKVLAKSQDDGAIKYIERSMRDSDLQMRLAAYRALAQRSPQRAAPIFVKAMQADDYMAKDPRERTTLAAALGETRTQLALDYFSSLFTSKGSLFNRSKVNDYKMMAIVGLTQIKSVASFKVLAREIKNRNNSKEIMLAARKAALRLKGEILASQDLASQGGERG
ncbi:MAG: HEAT repeat domain-containing protein [Myxococcota bacterium]